MEMISFINSFSMIDFLSTIAPIVYHFALNSNNMKKSAMITKISEFLTLRQNNLLNARALAMASGSASIKIPKVSSEKAHYMSWCPAEREKVPNADTLSQPTV
jgi:hypothetical protein